MRAPLGMAVTVLALGAFVAAPAAADPLDCYETLDVSDPYGLIWDTDVPVGLSTLFDVESLVDDYTSQIEDAVYAEMDGLAPSDDISSEELIDNARWEIEDAVNLGRSIAGCDDV